MFDKLQPNFFLMRTRPGGRGTWVSVDVASVAAHCSKKIVTWLILPVVICLSQRLSHACLSITIYTGKLRMAH